MTEQDVPCHACGKRGCPSAADPVGGAYTLHNAAAYAKLLDDRRRQEEERCQS